MTQDVAKMSTCIPKLLCYTQGKTLHEKPICSLPSGLPLIPGQYKALSHPVEAWHFYLRTPVNESERKTIDLSFHQGGRMNAVVFWYTLELIEGVTFSTSPEAVSRGDRDLWQLLDIAALKQRVGDTIISQTFQPQKTRLETWCRFIWQGKNKYLVTKTKVSQIRNMGSVLVIYCIKAYGNSWSVRLQLELVDLRAIWTIQESFQTSYTWHIIFESCNSLLTH